MLPDRPAAKPLVSIITPSLNQAKFLERTLCSVMQQEYPALEHIVIDGASTDGSVDILERYADQLSYWVSEPDRGQAHAINKGIERATGEILAYINSDDFYLTGAVEAATAAFMDPEVMWVVGTCRYEHSDGTVETIFQPARPRGPRAAWIRAPWYVPQATSFWRRTVFERFGLLREDLRYVLDTEHAVRLALHGVYPTIIDAQLAVRYLHDEAKSADPSAFAVEWKRIAPDLEKLLTRRDRVEDFLIRARRSAQRRVTNAGHFERRAR